MLGMWCSGILSAEWKPDASGGRDRPVIDSRLNCLVACQGIIGPVDWCCLPLSYDPTIACAWCPGISLSDVARPHGPDELGSSVQAQPEVEISRSTQRCHHPPPQ